MSRLGHKNNPQTGARNEMFNLFIYTSQREKNLFC